MDKIFNHQNLLMTVIRRKINGLIDDLKKDENFRDRWSELAEGV